MIHKIHNNDPHDPNYNVFLATLYKVQYVETLYVILNCLGTGSGSSVKAFCIEIRFLWAFVYSLDRSPAIGTSMKFVVNFRFCVFYVPHVCLVCAAWVRILGGAHHVKVQG